MNDAIIRIATFFLAEAPQGGRSGAPRARRDPHMWFFKFELPSRKTRCYSAKKIGRSSAKSTLLSQKQRCLTYDIIVYAKSLLEKVSHLLWVLVIISRNINKYRKSSPQLQRRDKLLLICLSAYLHSFI